MKKFIILGIIGGLAFATCPPEKDVKDLVDKIFRGKPEIANVSPVKELNLCQVVVKNGLRPVVLYVNKDMSHLIVGNVIDLKEGKNLTAEARDKFAKVDEETLKELEKLTDLTYGEGNKYVYFISDPDCPFCRRLEPVLKDWAKKNKVQIRHIFYPLPIHPKAKDKAVDIICSGKGYEYVHKDFEPKNLCEKGKEKVEKNIEFLSKLGVSGTPTLIGMNGKVQVGLPRSEEELDRLIK
ncbi:DsbC family protein [Aquifex pyrophilus]